MLLEIGVHWSKATEGGIEASGVIIVPCDSAVSYDLKL